MHKLGNSYLRIDFAQDVDGFWLEPHPDNGGRHRLATYMSKDPAHATGDRHL